MRIDGWFEGEGLTFAYRAWGDPGGAPILLLHGFPDSPGTFDPLAELLVLEGFRPIAPWLRGYGPTGGAVRGLGQLGKDVIAAADALSPGEPIPVIGHDWGAAAGCIAATLAPDRISSFVMMGLPHPAHFLAKTFADPAQLRRSWYMWFFQLPELPEMALTGEDYDLIDTLWRDWSPGLAKAPHRDEMVETFERGGLEGPVAYYRAVFADTVIDDPADAALYGPVGTRTLAIMGEDDGCISAEYLQGQDHYWQTPPVSTVVPGCGHFLHLERPDVVADLVLSFLGARGQI